MNKNKFGFTLAEVLVSVAVIGVIMALSVNSIKIVKASYTSLAYFAYNNVSTMAAMLYSDDQSVPMKQSDGTNLPTMLSQCTTEDGLTMNVLKSDAIYNSTTTPHCVDRVLEIGGTENLFCKGLSFISNTAGAVNCTNLFPVNTTGTEPYIEIDSDSTPTFKTTNGQRYFLSQWNYDSSVSSIYGYRILAVDLNGSRKPNKTEHSGITPPPDIVSFLILDNGEVFPIGIAGDNLVLNDGRKVQYIHSKVKGYYYRYDASRTDNISQDCMIKTKDGLKSQCNYAIVNVQNTDGLSFFTFREAYCSALGGKESAYSSYCTGATSSPLCPPSTHEKAFDLCRLENIKPAFRYNL